MFIRLCAFLFSFVAIATAGSHKDWRLLIQGCQNCVGSPTAKIEVFDFEMYDSAGNYLPTGGTPTASGSSGGTSPANAFDRSQATSWQQWVTPSTSSPSWLRYSFVSAVDVATVRLVESVSVGDQDYWPVASKMQYSDDGGVTWTDATGSISPTWSAPDGYGSWSFTVDPPSGGYFVNWRVLTTSSGPGTGFQAAVSELAIKNISGGSNIASPSTPYSFATGYPCCYNPANLYDGNVSTYVYSSGLPFVMGYSFALPYKVIETDITNVNQTSGPSWNGSSPTAVQIQGSNDAGMNWFTAFSCSGLVWTAQDQTLVCGAVPDQRGNIAYNQIRANDREGNAHQFQMFGGGATIAGHQAAYDGEGNVVDGGVYTMGLVTAPASHLSPCTVSQLAVDGAGNFYWCYATNLWARIGPGGYSSSF